MNLLQTLKLLAIVTLALPAFAQTTITVKPSNITVPVTNTSTEQTTKVFDTQTGKETLIDLTVLNRQVPTITDIVISPPPTPKIGSQGKGSPFCGGIVNGKPQAPCAAITGTFESQALHNCPAGSTFDAITWSCWTCPPGWQRTGYAMDGTAACSIADASVRGELKAALYAGPLCAPGTFHDPIRGGECYSCPSGYERSWAHIDAPNACYVRATAKFSFAELSFRTGDARHCVNRADGADRGQLVFWDAYDHNYTGPGCWKCPVGYARTHPGQAGFAETSPVYSNTACIVSVPEQHARATVVKKAECGPGEIHDMKIPGKQDPATGGGCYSCPTGTARSVNDVTAGAACSKDAGVRLTKANKEASLSCPAGQDFDFISSRHPKVQALANKQFAGKTLPQGFGTNDGGTCWSCPPGTKRGTIAVYELGGCETQIIKWQPAPYGQPGMFGLDGGEEVAQAIVRDRRDMINELAQDLYGKQMSPAEARRLVWDEIATTPHTSGVLAIAVLSRVQAALKDPSKATDAERRLAAAFALAARDFRIFIAQNALDAYDAWNVADSYYRTHRATEPGLLVLFDYGTVPPDFYEVSGSILAGTAGASGAMGTAIGLAMMSSKVSSKILPYTMSTAGSAGKRVGFKVAENVSRAVVKEIATKSAKAVGATLKMISGIGPQIVITLAIEAIMYSSEQVIAMLDARPKLLTRLATAQQPMDLARLLATEAGGSEMNNMWSLAMGSEVATKNLAAFKQAATEEMNAATTWTLLQGSAVDIAASANALWVIGTNPVPGGYGLQHWDGKTFVSASGGAVRIDLDPQGNPWVVNDKDDIFRWTGSAWVGLPGKAKDIGIGADGTVWAIGANKVPGGFGVYRWDAAKNVWLDMRGGGVRIDVDASGKPWVVNDAGKIFFGGTSGWREYSYGVLARDIGVGPEGSVFIAAKNDGAVYKFDRDSLTWIKRNGGLNEISVGPGGVPVGVNAGKQIWMGYP
ncbi:MAG: hypothetical protein Q8K23_03670 [Sulfuritalea sp.]|nr:hypothetical protein [Sulfuritalea sp.]